MKVLVIGGTRFFGKLIVENLLSEGFDVSIFTRGNIKPRFSRPVRHVKGDRRDYPSFISKVEAELGFRSTPFAKWLEKVVRWYIEEYRGQDSLGYDKRRLEIKFSEIWQKKKLEIRTLCS